MRVAESKIIPFAKLRVLADRLRAEGKRIVTTNGCFDLLHWGHVKYLEEARARGDCLILGLNSDASVRMLKGASRPLQPEGVRALTLAGLESVDYVAVFEEQEPTRFLEQIRPAVHVKGGDYTPERMPERETVEGGGGRIEIVSFVGGYSTTRIITKLKEMLADEKTRAEGQVK